MNFDLKSLDEFQSNFMITQRENEIFSPNGVHLNPFKKEKSQRDRYKSLGSMPSKDITKLKLKDPKSETEKKQFGFRTRRTELKSILESCSPKELKKSNEIYSSINRIQEEYDHENDNIQRCVDAY